MNVGGTYPTSDFPDGTNLRYDYFLITEAKMSEDHTAQVTLPTPSGTEMTYNAEAINRACLAELNAVNAQITAGTLQNTFAVYSFDTDYDPMVEAIKSAITADADNSGNGVTFTIYAIGGVKTANELLQQIWNDVGQYSANSYNASVGASVDSSFFRDTPTVHLRITIGPSAS